MKGMHLIIASLVLLLTACASGEGYYPRLITMGDNMVAVGNVDGSITAQLAEPFDGYCQTDAFREDASEPFVTSTQLGVYGHCRIKIPLAYVLEVCQAREGIRFRVNDPQDVELGLLIAVIARMPGC